MVSDPGELEVKKAALRHRDYLEGGKTDAAVQAQYEYLGELQLERSKSHRLILEYGNTSSPGASKTNYVTFLNATNSSAWQKAGLGISKVDFNINPRYDKPTASVSRAGDRNCRCHDQPGGRTGS